MVTISADVTPKMAEWVDNQVNKGLYKSRSEVIRELFREKIQKKNYSYAMASQSALKEIWDNEEDDVWESYL